MARRQDQSVMQKIIVSTILLYVVFYIEPISEGLYWLRQICIFLLCITVFKFTLSFLDLVRNLLLRWYALTPSQKYGSARWASEKDLKRSGMFKTNGLFLGTSARSGKPIFFSGETHGLTLSPAGGGKTVNFFIPALLHNDMPMIVPDLKGTLACITKRTREKRHKNKVYCVNPARLYEKKLGKPARYNPLQILVDSWESGNHEDLITDAQSIALQLLTEPPQSGENSFFRNGGRMIIVFCILHLVIHKTDKSPNLSDVLRLIRNEALLKEALYLSSTTSCIKGDLADIAHDLLAKVEQNDKRQWESFREGAVQALSAFSASGWLSESTSACDFRFSDLKKKKATVFLIADPTRMSVYAPWLGLLGWCALTELTRCQSRKQVLFLFDEAANFKIQGLTAKLTELRGYGCRVWFALQSLDAFAKTYGKDDLETLLEQCECQQLFAIQSHKTALLVSKTLGDTTVKGDNYNLGNIVHDPVNLSVGEHARPLLTPDEVRQFPDSIILVRGQPPIHALKVGYHEVSPWKKWADIDPMYGKKFKSKTKLYLRY
ncbi:MAG: type IV secretory system conjugative DNA transfer family protein [Alphaproteobacteria bacterium]|nr:type IV secretory system conjugative DNA transfer family protein [Alphaproteobacteria bacterium]